ncbi:glycosyltransferase family 2 protein [Flexithrix dorotheae]|uniref:glycosyltransferase family 2 protein n=1 Tax=Flexithrix dorotheae TaxID=70993 RepID=UPI00037F8601|nr:glycosyltransferase family 2 protein [Flexithrix dorotheae]
MEYKVLVIIPAFNEEKSIGKVINDIPKDFVTEIVVVNNASTDQTAEEASKAGATVLNENRQGYGFACLKGIEYAESVLAEKENSIIVFIDGDYSDFPQEMPDVVRPIVEEDYHMVIGSRALGKRESGSMTPQQIFGNWLATKLLKLYYNADFTDLGPFRAIRFDKLLEIDMKDQTYGWTVEMQVKAAKHKLRFCEVKVNYKKRIGVSKVSGTIKGTILAGYKILWTLFKYR